MNSSAAEICLGVPFFLFHHLSQAVGCQGDQKDQHKANVEPANYFHVQEIVLRSTRNAVSGRVMGWTYKTRVSLFKHCKQGDLFFWLPSVSTAILPEFQST